MLIWFTEKIRNLLWNVYQYYRQFVPNVDKFISDTRKTISEAVKVSSMLHIYIMLLSDYYFRIEHYVSDNLMYASHI